MRRFVLILAACLFLCLSAPAQEPTPLVRETVKTISELRAIGLPSSVWDGDQDVLQAGPPARVPGLLRRLNSELRALIIQTLNDPDRHQIADGDMILNQLRAAGWKEISDHKWNAYGEIVDIRFDWRGALTHDPEIVVVTTQLWVPCGENDPDAAIYVFEGTQVTWRLDIAIAADFSSEDASAGGMQYKLSRPDERGAWFLAVAHTPPGCHSGSLALTREFEYEVVRPSSDPDKPVVVVSGRQSILDRFHPPFSLAADSDWFSFTTGQSRTLDGDPGVVESRFQIEGNRATRIEPLADSPEDFLDQWVRLGADDAARWKSDPAAPDLMAWHERLRTLRPDSLDFDSTRSCDLQRGAEETMQLELAISRSMNPNFAESKVFVLLDKRYGDFRVASIGTSPYAGCSGPARKPSSPPLELPE